MNEKAAMDAPPPHPGQPGTGAPMAMTMPQQQHGYVYTGGPQTGQPMRPGVTVVHTGGHQLGVPFFGANPINITCPNCGSHVVTSITTNPGLKTWLLCGACVIFGCGLGCCLIPFCIPELQDVEHSCPNCKCLLGTHRR